MSKHHQPNMRVYSDQTSATGGPSDGYNVVVNAADLDDATKTFEAAHKNASVSDLVDTLLGANDAVEWGTIPNSDKVRTAVANFIKDHMFAMSDMNVDLVQFVGRVQAAAQQGHDLDPATKQRAAYIQAHTRPQ